MFSNPRSCGRQPFIQTRLINPFDRNWQSSSTSVKVMRFSAIDHRYLPSPGQLDPSAPPTTGPNVNVSALDFHELVAKACPSTDTLITPVESKSRPVVLLLSVALKYPPLNTGAWVAAVMARTRTTR